MNELEQLQYAKSELGVTLKLLQRQLKTYATANVNYAGVRIKEVGNAVLEAYKNMQDKIAEHKAVKYEQERAKQAEKEAEMNRMQAEALEEQARRERTKEHAEAMKEILKEQAREQRQERIMNFKNGVAQKVASAKAKLGSVKTAALEKLMVTKNNFDLKLQNGLAKAKLGGMVVAGVALESANFVKNYTSEQIASFRAWKYEQERAREEKRAEKEAEMNRMQAEALEEQARRERTKEHAEAMKEILREQDRKALLEEQAQIRERLRQQKELLIAEKEKLLGSYTQTEEQVYEGRQL